MTNTQDIAIIGVGCWFPGSPDPKTLWENVLARRAQFRRFVDSRLPVEDYVDPVHPDRVYAHKAAYIDGFEFDWQKHRVPRSTFEHTDVVQWLALDVALQALANADLDLTDAVRERTGVIVGNSLTGEQSRASTLRLRWPFVRKALRAAIAEHGLSGAVAESLEQATRDRFLSVFPSVDEDSLQGGLSNTIAGRICNYLDLKGGGYVVDGACSSSLLAVATGANRLITGDLDVAIVGGVDVSLDPMELVGFSRAGALTPDQMRVYDAAGNGFIPGEGAGFVVLKRLVDARRDGDDVVAVLRGWGVSSDGRGAITAPSGAGQARAIVRAYQSAGLTPDDVQFVEGHGTGTRAGDLAELQGLQMAFERLGGDPEHRWGLTSLKSLVGHMKAAAGMGGLVKAVLSVNQRVLPPTAGITKPHAAFGGTCPNLYPLRHGAQRAADATLRAGVSAMGFGGINTHVLVESADPPDPAFQSAHPVGALLVASQTTELLCLSAADSDGLETQLNQLMTGARPLAVSELGALASDTNRRWKPSLPWRAALTVSDPDHLCQVVEALLAALPKLGDEPMSAADGCWWLGQALSNPVIGFVYPGQGSQYVGAASVPMARHSWARDMRMTLVEQAVAVDAADVLGWTAQPDLPESRVALAAELMRTEVAQPSLCLTSAVYTEWLRRLGVRPAMVGGHSLGELSALWAAGGCDLSTLFDWAITRGQAMNEHAPDGAMASLRCAFTEAEALVASISGVQVCNRNTPDHTVVGGSSEAIDTVVERAHAQGFSARRLSVSRAFHTAQMDLAAAALEHSAFAGVRLPELGCVWVSGVDGRAMESGTDLLGYVQKQLRVPVDFTALTRRMAAVCDVLIEVGSGRVLSGLVNHTVGAGLCMPVETATDGGDALNRSLARLSVWGVPLALDALYAGRPLPTTVAFDQRVFIDNPCERPMHSEHVPVPVTATEAPSELSPELLKRYLVERGDFLVDVLTADLRSSGKTPQIRPVVAPVQRPAEPVQRPTPTPVQPEVQPSDESVQSQLITLLMGKTGFTADAISPDSRLLDELNLDSIKAGEVLYTAAEAFGVAGQVELSEFTNATVSEIAARFESARRVVRAPDEQAPSFQKANQWIRRFKLAMDWRPRQALLDLPMRPGEVLVVHDQSADLEAVASRVAPCHWQSLSGAWTETVHAHAVLILPALDEPLAAVDTLSELLPAVLRRTRDTLLVVVHGAPLGLHFDGAQRSVGVSSLLASVHAERPELAITVLHLLEAPKDAAWIEPAMETSMRAHGFATLAVWPDAPDQLAVPVLRRELDRVAPPELGDVDDLWLVTGGARGITLACALSLAGAGARRFVLLGRTPMPDDPGHAIHQALARFRQAGADARYVRCDLTDSETVAQVLGAVQSELGPVRHVVHGAGVNHVARFESTTRESALREVRVKVGGLRNLLDAVDVSQLRSVVGLSSVIGVFGMPGNAWYAFANEALDGMIADLGRSHTNLHARTVAFSLWGEIGMIERLSTVGHLKRMGVMPLPTADGTRAFLSSYVPGGGARMLVTGSLGDLPGWSAMIPKPLASEAFGGEVLSVHPGVEAVVRLSLSYESDVYLEDHNFEGSRLFPTVMGLQAMADAAALVLDGLGSAMTFEQVSLSKPITVRDTAATTVMVHAQVPDDDPNCVDIGLYTEQTGFQEAHFHARLRLGAAEAVPRRASTMGLTPLDLSPQRDLYGDLLFQGPRFQKMGELLALDADHIVLRALPADVLEPIRPGVSTPSLGSPYLRDLLLQAPAVPLAPDQLLPISIGRLVRYAAAPSDAVVHAQITGRMGDEIEAEVWLCDAEGTVVEHLTGYRARVVRRRPERPSATDLLEPTAFNLRSLRQGVDRAMSAWQLPVPDVDLTQDARLSDPEPNSRHRAQNERVSARVAAQYPQMPPVEVVWSEAGRPSLAQPDGSPCPVQVSMSHGDQGLFLSALHTGAVGCDVERVADRSFSEWQFMLGARNAILFNRIFSVGGTLAEAGHQVWSAMEVAVKLGVPDDAQVLELLGFREGVTAFWVRDTRFTIVTFAFQPLGAAPVVVGLGIERPYTAADSVSAATEVSNETH